MGVGAGSNGATILGGSYNASSVSMKNLLIGRRVSTPQPGDIRWTPRGDGINTGHVGIVSQVLDGGSKIRYVSGNSGTNTNAVTQNNIPLDTNAKGAIYVRPNYGSNDPTRALNVALSQLGVTETGNNKTKYGEWYGMDGNAWCAMFVSWCFHQAYDSDADFSPVGPMESLGQWNDNQYAANNYTNLGVGVDGLTFQGTVWGNSSLVTYVSRLSNGNYYTRTNRANHITVHNAFATADIATLANMANSSGKAYNYAVDANGEIGLFVDEQMYTNSCDSLEDDLYGINIICSGTKSKGFDDLAAKVLVDLLEDIYRRNFIYLITFNGNKDDTLTLHSMYNQNVDCPGEAAVNQLKQIIQIVNARLGAKVNTNFVQVGAKLAESETVALRNQSLINVSQIHPYVVTLDPEKINLEELNIQTLYQQGVVGAFIDIGKYSKKNHYPVDKIYALIEALHKDLLRFPFGFIIRSTATTAFYNNEQLDAKAQENTTNEVAKSYRQSEDDKSADLAIREEAYWLRFIITKYPPKLGVWLDPSFKAPEKDHEDLVDAWYDFFVDWGLKSKCGLLCTKDQAKVIGWPKQCNYLPLWLSGQFDNSIAPDDELLTPTFFKLNDLGNYGVERSEYLAGNFNQLLGVDMNLRDSSIDTVGSKAGIYSGEFEVKAVGNGAAISVPQVDNHAVAKKWESYTAIKSTSTMNYKITHSSKTITDSMGFRKFDNRYLIAVGSGVYKAAGLSFTSSNMGLYVDVVLGDGTIIPCIVADGKSDAHTESRWRLYTNVNPVWCCSEFIMDRNKKPWQGGDCSKVNGWDSPVVQIITYNKKLSPSDV